LNFKAQRHNNQGDRDKPGHDMTEESFHTTSRVVPLADAAEAIFDPGPKVVFVSGEGERT
jgi:hypothetical protein